MSLLDAVHGGYVHERRTRELSRRFAELIPRDARVLDVGCGDGLLARQIARRRPDAVVEGIDVRVREHTHVPVSVFDGRKIPGGDDSFDVVMFVDVLHHTHDPMILLREALRVSRTAVLIKDHTRNGLLAGPTLRAMDWVGNARHGVDQVHNYWPRWRWIEAFATLGLRVDVWIARLGLYPWPASWVFGRSLHFMARLTPALAGPPVAPELSACAPAELLAQ